MREFDLVVIGAGVAGLTAAMVAAQHGLRVVVVGQGGAGGQVVNAERIENFPGFPKGISGYDLGPLIQEQAEAAGAEVTLGAAVSLTTESSAHVVQTMEEILHAPAVIVAAGSSPRSLGIPGETQFDGRGVSHCASCDGLFFAGRDVYVVGGGDSALDEALTLAEHVASVTIVQRGAELTAQQTLIDRVAAHPRLSVLPNTEVEAIQGEQLVSSLLLRDLGTGEARRQAANGVFIYVGLEPNTAFLQGVLQMDRAGHIETDVMMQTSLAGVFAAGDIRAGSVAQLATAAGDGATAAVAAYRYLRRP